MKHLLKVAPIAFALLSCDSGKPKSIGKLVVSNRSPNDIEVIRFRNIGDTSASGSVSSGTDFESFFASETPPTSCTIEWRQIRPKGTAQRSSVSMAHLAGTRLGGYQFILDSSLKWKVAPVPYPGSPPPPKP